MSPTPGALSLFSPHSPSYAIGDGGPPPGSENIGYAAGFLGRRAVRDTWIAVAILWIVWAILFLARQTFGPTRVFDAPRSERGMTSNVPVATEGGPYDVQNGVAGGGTRDPGPTLGNGGVSGAGDVSGAGGVAHRPGGGVARNRGFLHRTVDSVRDRVDRTYKLVRDLTLMLMVVVTLNTLGLGSGVAVLVLTWIFLGITLIWAGLMMLIESRIIDLVLGFLQMLILLGIVIAAFAIGWDVRY
ncbi:hypothetical protein EC991_001659 [Linnemannia zychae]|nr:hypothetical protein EC991_001659 [Linnemannia zychae]